MQRAVLYLRSSKDRHDVAIEVQRRELTELALARGYVVAGEFADVVESGKDEDRPGLQALLAALYAKDRTWSIVLALDTSRIARRAAAAYWFEDRECRPRGVSVVYKNLPEMEEAERAIVKAVFHGVDEWHSLVSKRKGLAGMRENVRAGKRAGGRAPFGYRLEHEPTGAVRDGVAVVKSRLVATELAPALRAYLLDRAAGIPRHAAGRRHLASIAHTTLLSIERNALTYAGHTVWNRLNEKGRLGPRERPRSNGK
jgi:site-specific DNA recombinase